MVPISIAMAASLLGIITSMIQGRRNKPKVYATRPNTRGPEDTMSSLNVDASTESNRYTDRKNKKKKKGNTVTDYSGVRAITIVIILMHRETMRAQDYHLSNSISATKVSSAEGISSGGSGTAVGYTEAELGATQGATENVYMSTLPMAMGNAASWKRRRRTERECGHAKPTFTLSDIAMPEVSPLAAEARHCRQLSTQ